MEPNKINQLLEKYFEAETTLAEEKELKAYFNAGQVAPEHQEYAPLFGFFKEEKQITFNKTFIFPEDEQKNKNTSRSLYLKWGSIAASIAILASVFWFSPYQNKNTVKTKTIDQEIAMAHTQDLLFMMGDAFKEGKNHLSYLNEIEQTKTQLINK